MEIIVLSLDHDAPSVQYIYCHIVKNKKSFWAKVKFIFNLRLTLHVKISEKKQVGLSVAKSIIHFPYFITFYGPIES